MKIEIATKNVKNETAIKKFIEQKVHSALEQIEERIGTITVRLEDQTKDSAAFEGVCQIDVSIRPRGHVHVSANGDSASASVIQATRKIEHAIKHDIDRHRSSSRIRHEQGKRQFLESLKYEDESDSMPGVADNV